MTTTEKHALIAEKLDGYVWLQYRHPADARYASRKLLNVAMHDLFKEADMSAPIDPLNSGPNYSSDLNLCAHVEAKILSMGHIERYADLLCVEMGKALVLDFPEITVRCWYIIAKPQHRVDAMVALIQELGL